MRCETCSIKPLKMFIQKIKTYFDDQIMILKLTSTIKSQIAKHDFQTTQNHVSDKIGHSEFQMI